MKRYPFNRHGRIVPKTPSRTKVWVDSHTPKCPPSSDLRKKIKNYTATRASGNDNLATDEIPSKAPIGSQEQYKEILLEQYGFQPEHNYTSAQLEELKQVLGRSIVKVENCSQYSSTVASEAPHSAFNVETVKDVDALVAEAKLTNVRPESERAEAKNVSVQQDFKSSKHLQNVHISEVPKIKFIAEKFSRFKKHDIEVRKMNEKIVCVEYDVFDKDHRPKIAAQKLRAYFSIKPKTNENNKTGGSESPIKDVPSRIRKKYKLKDDDLTLLSEKEIEIMDETITENQSYLNDLKKILKRKQCSKEKQKNVPDVNYLYEMAKRESPPLDYDYSKLLSKLELDEIKDLILRRRDSNLKGISRKFVKQGSNEGYKVGIRNTILDLMNNYSTIS